MVSFANTVKDDWPIHMNYIATLIPNMPKKIKQNKFITKVIIFNRPLSKMTQSNEQIKQHNGFIKYSTSK